MAKIVGGETSMGQAETKKTAAAKSFRWDRRNWKTGRSPPRKTAPVCPTNRGFDVRQLIELRQGIMINGKPLLGRRPALLKSRRGWSRCSPIQRRRLPKTDGRGRWQLSDEHLIVVENPPGMTFKSPFGLERGARLGPGAATATATDARREIDGQQDHHQNRRQSARATRWRCLRRCEPCIGLDRRGTHSGCWFRRTLAAERNWRKQFRITPANRPISGNRRRPGESGKGPKSRTHLGADPWRRRAGGSTEFQGHREVGKSKSDHPLWKPLSLFAGQKAERRKGEKKKGGSGNFTHPSPRGKGAGVRGPTVTLHPMSAENGRKHQISHQPFRGASHPVWAEDKVYRQFAISAKRFHDGSGAPRLALHAPNSASSSVHREKKRYDPKAPLTAELARLLAKA